MQTYATRTALPYLLAILAVTVLGGLQVAAVALPGGPAFDDGAGGALVWVALEAVGLVLRWRPVWWIALFSTAATVGLYVGGAVAEGDAGLLVPAAVGAAGCAVLLAAPFRQELFLSRDDPPPRVLMPVIAGLGAVLGALAIVGLSAG